MENAVNVFISYKSEDAEFAVRLKERLHQEGVATVWRDKDDIVNGNDWATAIEDALASASLIVLIISPASMCSAYVTYEWCRAIFSLNKPLYFVYLHHCTETTGVFGRLMSRQLPPVLSFPPTEVELSKIAVEVKMRVQQTSRNLPVIKNAVQGLTSEDENRRMQAVKTLASCSANGGIEALIDAVNDKPTVFPKDVHVEAAFAVLAMDEHKKDEKVIPGLQEALDPHNITQCFRAIQYLGIIGTDDAVQVLAEFLSKLKDDRRIRQAIMDALGQTSNPIAIPTLKSMLFIDDSNVSEVAVKALGKIGDPSAIPEIIQVIQTHQFLGMQEAAIEALGKFVQYPEVLEVLRNIFHSKEENRSRRRAKVYPIVKTAKAPFYQWVRLLS